MIAKPCRTAILAFLAALTVKAQTAAPQPQGTVRFGGIEWTRKDSGDQQVGPGPNWFSAENVTIDDGGRMHLRAGVRDRGCVAAEVVASPSLGYGTYRFTLDTLPDDLAGNLVLGLFVWDDSSALSFHREIDVEIGRWFQDDFSDAQFVIQPSTIPRNLFRFHLPQAMGRSVHSFTWQPDQASFRSEQVLPGGEKRVIQEHTFDRMIPEPGREQARINLWCADSKAPTGGAAEVVVDGFEFVPLQRAR